MTQFTCRKENDFWYPTSCFKPINVFPFIGFMTHCTIITLAASGNKCLKKDLCWQLARTKSDNPLYYAQVSRRLRELAKQMQEPIFTTEIQPLLIHSNKIVNKIHIL